MRAGLLNKIIWVKTCENRTTAYGDTIKEWHYWNKYRCNFKLDNGNREVENSEDVVNYTATITLRYNAQISSDMLIEYEGNNWRILAIFPDAQLQQKVVKVELINE